MTSQQGGNKPQRDEAGRLLPGGTANPGGRPKLPDWYRALGPDALRIIADIALGEREDARLSPGQAASLMKEHIYGRAPQASEDADAAAEAFAKMLSRMRAGTDRDE